MLERDPSSSIVGDLDFSHLESSALHEKIPFTKRHSLILLTFAATIAVILFGTFNWKWGLFEMSGTYIIGAIVGGVIAGYNSNKLAETLLEGGRAIFIGVVAVGMARGINVIMDQGNITDTLVRAISMPLSGLPESVTSIGMFVVQTIISFFIPSGSGQALVTLPIMLPVADIIELNRQIAILAFQFGDGLSNLCYPTVGVLVAFLLYTKVPFNKWLRFIMPFMLLPGQWRQDFSSSPPQSDTAHSERSNRFARAKPQENRFFVVSLLTPHRPPLLPAAAQKRSPFPASSSP
jgi:uncharacterized ion transporter superfamily protein YfcC